MKKIKFWWTLPLKSFITYLQLTKKKLQTITLNLQTQTWFTEYCTAGPVWDLHVWQYFHHFLVSAWCRLYVMVNEKHFMLDVVIQNRFKRKALLLVIYIMVQGKHIYSHQSLVVHVFLRRLKFLWRLKLFLMAKGKVPSPRYRAVTISKIQNYWFLITQLANYWLFGPWYFWSDTGYGTSARVVSKVSFLIVLYHYTYFLYYLHPTFRHCKQNWRSENPIK